MRTSRVRNSRWIYLCNTQPVFRTQACGKTTQKSSGPSSSSNRSRNRRFSRQHPSLTTRSDFIERFGVLTARRDRHITSASSWRPASAENGHGAKLPENSTHIILSGQKGLFLNG